MTRHTATADSPLPLAEFAEVAEVDQLRAALADVLTYLEDPARIAPANRVRAWRQLAGRPAVPGVEELTPEERRDEGIARAAARWTDEEAAAVDKTIADVAAARVDRFRDHIGIAADLPPQDTAAYRLLEFTTADVWAELGPRFPVTKGIAGRMLAAKAAGLVVNTGRTIIAPPDAPGPNHGQRLTVWQAVA